MMRILLAEDEPEAAEVMRRLLGDLVSVFDVTATLDGARELARTGTYDIIILDLRLIDATVEESIATIQELKRIADAPLVVVSGAPNTDLKARCIAAGADAFLHKMDACASPCTALLVAIHAAVLHHPKARTHTFMKHVEALERLVNCAN